MTCPIAFQLHMLVQSVARNLRRLLFACKCLRELALVTRSSAFRLRRLVQSVSPCCGLNLSRSIFPANFRVQRLL